MRVLVTGGAGFIGSHLIERLLAKGHDVMSLDNHATSDPANLAPNARLKAFDTDIGDQKLLNQRFDDFGPEAVVHAAASYKDPENWQEDARTNVLGTVNVVQASRRLGVKRFIYLQTSLCYGLHPEQHPITLDHPIRPAPNSYAISKTAGESYILISDLPFTIFRLANIFGPRNITGPIPTFFSRIEAGKPCFAMETRRDFVFVDDFTPLLVRALDGPERRGIYHVSSGSDVSIETLYHAVCKKMNVTPKIPLEIRPRTAEDAPTILLDASKTFRDFEWKAITPLELGIEKTIPWYRKHGVTRTYTHLSPAEIRS